MQGYREDDRRIVLRDPAELAEGLPIVLHVLKDVEGADQVEAAVGEWQGGNFAEHRETAAGVLSDSGRYAAGDARDRDSSNPGPAEITLS